MPSDWPPEALPASQGVRPDVWRLIALDASAVALNPLQRLAGLGPVLRGVQPVARIADHLLSPRAAGEADGGADDSCSSKSHEDVVPLLRPVNPVARTTRATPTATTATPTIDSGASRSSNNRSDSTAVAGGTR